MKNSISLLVVLFCVSCAHSPSKSTESASKPSDSKKSQKTEASATMLDCPAFPASSLKAPKLLWTTSGFSAPESAIYDSASNSIFVSNVVGSPGEKDGKGWISKIDADGKVIQEKWADGLNAPKGMAIKDGTLWVTDIDEIVGIDLKTGKRTVTIPVEGAKFMNDAAASNLHSGVFFSDMMTNKIYEMNKENKLSLFAEGPHLAGPNGLTVARGNLVIATWGTDLQEDFSTRVPGRVLSMNYITKKTTPWTKKSLGNLDGMELDGKRAVIVSDWRAGKVFRLQKKGSCQTLVEGYKGTADITFIPRTRTLIVPLMAENKVLGFHLPQY